MNYNCVFCNKEFKDASIKEYNFWDLQLFVDDQYYIGRTVAVLRGRHISNIIDLHINERKELFNDVLPDINNSLDNLFSPDLYNYASLGNDCRHLHFHIIPRYKKPVKFDNQVFIDEYWNQTYSQDYKRRKLDIESKRKLINLIKEDL